MKIWFSTINRDFLVVLVILLTLTGPSFANNENYFEEPVVKSGLILTISGFLGSSTSPLLEKEDKVVTDVFGYTAQYTNGHTEAYQPDSSTFGYGLALENLGENDWGLRLSYDYNSIRHTITAGNGVEYQKKSYGGTLIKEHHILLGPIYHLFIGSFKSMSLNFGLQAGVGFGTYIPLITTKEISGSIFNDPILSSVVTGINSLGNSGIFNLTGRMLAELQFFQTSGFHFGLAMAYQLKYSKINDNPWLSLENPGIATDLTFSLFMGISFF